MTKCNDIKDAIPLVCSLPNETDNFFKMTLLLLLTAHNITLQLYTTNF